MLHSSMQSRRYYGVFSRRIMIPGESLPLTGRFLRGILLFGLFRDGSPVPYDVTENLFPILCTDGHKVGTMAAVIIIDQPISLSTGKIHSIHSHFLTFSIPRGWSGWLFRKAGGSCHSGTFRSLRFPEQRGLHSRVHAGGSNHGTGRYQETC